MTDKPVPVPTPETQPFWDGCAAGELRIQRCTDCGKPYFYPRPVCPDCGSGNVEWFAASGRATLYSYVINHRAAPGFAVYAAAKAAVEQFGRTLAVELAPDGIRVNNIAPDYTPTPNITRISDGDSALSTPLGLRVAIQRHGHQRRYDFP